jgi:hypothetical protein
MNPFIRALITASALALTIWCAVSIYRAGGDVPAPPTTPQTKLTVGHAEGRRIDGKPSWSLDYDKVVTNTDLSTATLDGVHNGEIYKHGLPFMKLTAKHMVINTITNDFTITGPFQLVENDGKHQRTLTSDAATYTGFDQTLLLTHPSNIKNDGVNLAMKNAKINLKTGDTTMGPLIGIY